MMEALDGSPVSGEEDELWREWLIGRSASVRTRIFFFYAEWVRIVASSMLTRYPHPLAEWQDYVQFASQGLLKAIDRFDAAVQPNFRAYAEPYLKGDILRGLSCFVKDQQARASAVSVGANEATDELDLYGLEEIVEVAVGLAFGHFLELGVMDMASPGDPLDIYEAGRELSVIRQYVELLPVRERQLIQAHYFQHLPFSEVADLIGVSRPRITQLHKQAIDRVRRWYEDDDNSPVRLI